MILFYFQGSNEGNQVSSSIDVVSMTVNHGQHSNDEQLSTSTIARPDNTDSSDHSMKGSAGGGGSRVHK
jgi:hypothetical protein